ncbi:PAS domain S-box protein [Leptospira interrogans serovar Zanoni str. LT2156]|nr:PAS domain S-box protein [Leptospira interrogans serovar Zanoni str. LT2156]
MILDSTRVLFLALDREGRILRFNKACENAFGYRFKEVHGHTFWEIFVEPRKREFVKKKYFKMIRSNFIPKAQEQWISKFKERKVILWENREIKDDHSNTNYIISAGADLTDVYNAENEIANLKSANEEITKKNQMIEDQKKNWKKSSKLLKKLKPNSFKLQNSLTWVNSCPESRTKSIIR